MVICVKTGGRSYVQLVSIATVNSGFEQSFVHQKFSFRIFMLLLAKACCWQIIQNLANKAQNKIRSVRSQTCSKMNFYERYLHLCILTACVNCFLFAGELKRSIINGYNFPKLSFYVQLMMDEASWRGGTIGS